MSKTGSNDKRAILMGPEGERISCPLLSKSVIRLSSFDGPSKSELLESYRETYSRKERIEGVKLARNEPRFISIVIYTQSTAQVLTYFGLLNYRTNQMVPGLPSISHLQQYSVDREFFYVSLSIEALLFLAVLALLIHSLTRTCA